MAALGGNAKVRVSGKTKYELILLHGVYGLKQVYVSFMIQKITLTLRLLMSYIYIYIYIWSAYS